MALYPLKSLSGRVWGPASGRLQKSVRCGGLSIERYISAFWSCQLSLTKVNECRNKTLIRDIKLIVISSAISRSLNLSDSRCWCWDWGSRTFMFRLSTNRSFACLKASPRMFKPARMCVCSWNNTYLTVTQCKYGLFALVWSCYESKGLSSAV